MQTEHEELKKNHDEMQEELDANIAELDAVTEVREPRPPACFPYVSWVPVANLWGI